MSEKNIPCKLISQDFWKKDDSLVKLNPMLNVPFIKAHPNISLVGSQPIVEYFEEIKQEHVLMPTSPEERAEVRRLVLWFDEKFYHESAKYILWEKVFKFLKSGQEADQRILNMARSEMPYTLKYMQFLLKKRNYIAGNLFTVADITAASHISSIDYLGEINWVAYPIVKEWYCIIKSRPSFKQILLDRVAGFRPSAHYSEIDF